MQDFEKLGAFYLGKRYDPAQRAVTEDLLMYDAKDLCTHAVCVGMTGSGKTGLCLSLLEEAAIDGIPAIVIDPKGDLGNLMLTFPELKPADFRPWIDPSDATRNGMTPDEFAKATADKWKKGLAQWGQDGSRITRLQAAADIAIYTPASNAGLPLTVLRSFAAPTAAVLGNSEALRERIMSSVSGLLALLQIDADPISSREHILLSNILEQVWRAGQSIDMPGLLRAIQTPGFSKVGFMDLETFFPAKDRFTLAMSLNNLLASPGFAAWMEGEPLDVQRLLYTVEGKPRIAILSIAHLSDSERMFFVTILLNEVLAWMRSQPGTSSLRALLYMDEVFGYFPPTANPPSKLPMLTLLKQARAFGLGCVLATQNPVDLDYKGLANCGTWFLGRLQTERDKARILDGLEGASTSTGAAFNRAEVERLLSGLEGRCFLMNNVHDDGPTVFQTRWAMSYLRGPMTRDHIATLMAGRRDAAASTASMGAVARAAMTEAAAVARPVVPPGVSEAFLPVAGSASGSDKLVYRPFLCGVARSHFVDSGLKVDAWLDQFILRNAQDGIGTDPWADAEAWSKSEPPEFETQPDESASFTPAPAEMLQEKSYSKWATELKNWIYRTQTMSLHSCQSLKQTSEPAETEGEFRVRITQRLREERDVQVQKLRAKYASKVQTLEDRLRRADNSVEKQQSQQKSQTLSTIISVGTGLLGALLGGSRSKVLSAGNVTRAGTALRSATRLAQEKGETAMAQESREVVAAQLKELTTQLEQEVAALHEQFDPDKITFETLQVKPRKTDLSVGKVMLLWTPWLIGTDGLGEPAW